MKGEGSMLANKQHRSYTREEYLVLEEKAEYKSEYRQGEIVAMGGASLDHNRIVSNAHAALYNAIAAKSCEVFMSDLRLWIEKRGLYTYPDVTVICGEPKFVEGRTDTIVNPKIIIEVLSKSTENYDRGDKFHAYWTLDTFEEYVLVDQYRVHVEYFRRLDEKVWEIIVLTNMNDLLNLKSIEVDIPLGKIYRNVAFEE